MAYWGFFLLPYVTIWLNGASSFEISVSSARLRPSFTKMSAASIESGFNWNPPIVTAISDSSRLFIEECGKVMQLPVRYSDEPMNADPDNASLLVLDAAEVIADAKFINSLRAMGAIFLLHEGEEMDIESSARASCLYDIFVPTFTSASSSSGTPADHGVGCTAALAAAMRKSAVIHLVKLVATARGAPRSLDDTLLDAGEWSHFVSLTFPSVEAAVISGHLPSLRKGADAWELRVDLLEDQSAYAIHRQLALLRAAAPLPVVFTVRSEGQIGRHPDSEPERMFALLREGLRAGVEWLDVEACWTGPPTCPSDLVQALCREARRVPGYGSTTRLLGSLHVTTPQTDAQVTNLFDKCALGGAADLLKVYCADFFFNPIIIIRCD
jgi:3-dehydroquinate dehydratase